MKKALLYCEAFLVIEDEYLCYNAAAMRKYHLLIFGNYGSINWGDESILHGLLQQIPRDRFVVTVVTTSPQMTKLMHHVEVVVPPPFGIRSLLSLRWLKTLRVIRKADWVLFGGGGLLQDREPKAVLLWWWYAKVCAWFRKKTLWVGNSMGPLSEKSRKYAGEALENTRFLSVRDDASADLLAEMGITNAEQGTDFALLSKKAKAVKKRKGSLVCLRGDGRILSKKANAMLAELPQPVRILAMDKVDQSFAKSLKGELVNPQSLPELQEFFAQSEIVLGSRLHSGILALKHQTPFLLFEAAAKNKHFFKKLGLDEFVIPEKISIRAFHKKLKELLKKKKDISSKLQKIYRAERQKGKMLLPVFLSRR